MGSLVDTQGAADEPVEALVVEDERDLVDARRVDGGDHGLHGHVAQVGDLALQVLRDRLVAPADDDVGLDTATAQLGHRVLRRLGLLLTGDQVGHQGQVHVADVLPPHVPAELSDGLNEGHDLDVAHRAADLHNDDVDVVIAQPAHPLLDLVGHVRDDLDGAAEEVPSALLLDHRAVDPSRGGVGVLAEILVDEPLVVPEIEVRLTAVVGHEDLAVLAGVHRPGVDVDVRIELAHGDPQATAFEESTE